MLLTPASDLPHWGLSGFWGRAIGVWERIASEWGKPSDIAAQPRISYFSILDLRRWVRGLERFVRYLVLAAALAFDPGAVRQHKPGPARQRRRVLLWPHKPEQWPARLTLLPRERDERPTVPRNPDPRRTGTFDAWPLAIRLQAIFNVIENPNARVLSCARALARIRARNATANCPRRLGVRELRKPRTDAEHIFYQPTRDLIPHVEAALGRWQPPEPD